MFGEQTFTLTFCECAENHKGMQQIGIKCKKGEGFTIEELERMFSFYHDSAEFHRLDFTSDREPAAILIIRNGLGLMGIDHRELFLEHNLLNKDTKALMRNRYSGITSVVNKKARHNLCFADFDQEPNYSEGKGTVINFNRLLITNHLRNTLPSFFGPKCQGMYAEGNYYYNIHKCGINWHGDIERKRVVGVRLGRTIPLCFRWYKNGVSDGITNNFQLNSGDIYIFSEKATGSDCYDNNKWVLKHAAGSEEYVD